MKKYSISLPLCNGYNYVHICGLSHRKSSFGMGPGFTGRNRYVEEMPTNRY